jgi:hypothetical protein
MFETDDERQRAEIIIMILAKLYIVLEFSPDPCPLCRKTLGHDVECPVSLAWSFLDDDQQQNARTAIRALALSLGCDESIADPMTH